MKIFSAVMFLVASVSCHFMIMFCAENRLLELNSKIQNEQISDFQNDIIMLSARKTYEDGLRDGIMNSKSSSYVQGYHAALNQSNSFSELISLDQEWGNYEWRRSTSNNW